MSARRVLLGAILAPTIVTVTLFATINALIPGGSESLDALRTAMNIYAGILSAVCYAASLAIGLAKVRRMQEQLGEEEGGA